jgi:hypothetical protein
MTFEQCQAVLTEIRRRRGTDHPLLQVTCSGAVLRGRLCRSDSDRPVRPNHDSPYGLLVLEQPGLFPGPLTFVQIASIPQGGIVELVQTEDSHATEPELVGAAR